MYRFISKWISEEIRSGLVMHQHQQCKHSNYPFCKADNETIQHVLHCTCSSHIHVTLLQHLQARLSLQHADPRITTFLITGLTKMVPFSIFYSSCLIIRSNIHLTFISQKVYFPLSPLSRHSSNVILT